MAWDAGVRRKSTEKAFAMANKQKSTAMIATCDQFMVGKNVGKQLVYKLGLWVRVWCLCFRASRPPFQQAQNKLLIAPVEPLIGFLC